MIGDVKQIEQKIESLDKEVAYFPELVGPSNLFEMNWTFQLKAIRALARLSIQGIVVATTLAKCH